MAAASVVANAAARQLGPPPLASIGILTDIQCADLPNGSNYLKTETRYYRHALVATKRAVEAFRKSTPPFRVSTLIHLGDLIDGFNADQDTDRATSERVLAESLQVLPPPSTTRIVPPTAALPATQPLTSYSVMGNHELMNFPRSKWANVLGIAQLSEASRVTVKRKRSSDKQRSERRYRFVLTDANEESGSKDTQKSAGSAGKEYASTAPCYYDLEVAGRFRVIMLDAYEISTLGYADIHPQPLAASLAHQFLAKENPNENKNSPLNLEGKEKRKVAFNGGVSDRQLDWMRGVLDECREKGQHALVCSHVACHPKAAHPSALLWNQDEVLDLLHDYADVVVGFLSGHDHDGGHVVDEHGITHHTLEAILTTPDGHDAYGRMDFYEDGIEVVGTDVMSSFSMKVPARRVTRPTSGAKDAAKL